MFLALTLPLLCNMHLCSLGWTFCGGVDRDNWNVKESNFYADYPLVSELRHVRCCETVCGGFCHCWSQWFFLYYRSESEVSFKVQSNNVKIIIIGQILVFWHVIFGRMFVLFFYSWSYFYVSLLNDFVSQICR